MNSCGFFRGVAVFNIFEKNRGILAFVIMCMSWISFSSGIVFGHVASVIGALQKAEEGLHLSDGEISFLATLLPTTCIIGFGLAAPITDKVGRRWPYVFFSIWNVINWIILYHATEMYHFVLSRIIGGISVGALASLNILIPSEYTSPDTRAFYLAMISIVTPAFGTSLAHAIGVVLHWRTVTLIGMFATSIGIVIPYFWVESPHWLASKGMFEESQTIFRMLHGNKPRSERELQLLIKMEKRKLEKADEINCKSTSMKLFRAFGRKYFWELLLLSAIVNIYITAAGKLLFSILATVILEEITGTSNVLLFTLLVDGFIILGSCMSCVLIRKSSIRTLLFNTGFMANCILMVLSICLYLKNGQTLFNWINVTLLSIYFIVMHSGPYPVLEVIMSEIFPLELKAYTFTVSGLVFIPCSSTLLFLLPQIVSSIGYHGLFLINSGVMSLCLGYIWLVLPETKGKTLQEIEMYFKANTFDVEQVLSNEHTKALI